MEPGAQPDTITLRHVAVIFVADPFEPDNDEVRADPADMLIPTIGLNEFGRALGRLKWENVVAESAMDEDGAKEVVSETLPVTLSPCLSVSLSLRPSPQRFISPAKSLLTWLLLLVTHLHVIHCRCVRSTHSSVHPKKVLASRWPSSAPAGSRTTTEI